MHVSMSPTPLVTAVVLNYRSWRDVLRCVRALKRQTIADRVEILVMDNRSGNESIGSLRNRLGAERGVRILESPVNRGYGQGNEVAIRQARGEYLLIINPDNELLPDALEKMVDAMALDPSIGILAPKLIHEDGTVRDSHRAFPGLLDVIAKRTVLRAVFPARVRKYLQADADPDGVRDVDWVVGACLLLRRSFYTELGGFDPRFFLFFEDIDLCRRCWLAGKRVVYFPRAVAADRKRRLSEGGVFRLLAKKTGRIHVASALKYFWKWRGVRNDRLESAVKF